MNENNNISDKEENFENNNSNIEINDSSEESRLQDYADEDNDLERKDQPKESKKKTSVKREIFSWILTIIVALFIASIIRAFVFDHAIVNGSSMDNTLQNNEHLIIYKLGYFFYPPQRGDIIMLEYKKGFFKYLPFPDPQEIDYIKRVIAVPGDKVDIIDGRVYLNGKKQIESYAVGITERKDKLKFPFKVPNHKVFVLGDNREFSSDSREIGLIDYDAIKGKAVFSIYPLNEIGIIH
jgi:signal peptidase I